MMSQYRPGILLGQGSQGTVLLAKHVVSKIDYAIKVVSKAAIKKLHSSDDKGFQEIEILRSATQTKCRNIAGLVQAMEDDKNFFIVTKYIKGGTLYAH